MYYVIVALLMVICPIASIFLENAHHPTELLLLVSRWFVFWAVGVRLLLAGARQVLNPRYTAATILGLRGNEVLFIVRELGFANVAFGILGISTLVERGWTGAAALAGGLFYMQAGINHVFHAGRNRLANVAMLTDLAAGAILLGSFWVLMQR